MSVIILFCCGANLFAVKQNTTIKNKVPVDSIKTGNELYMKNCASCHKLIDPAKYTKVQWPDFVNKMQKRAKITDAQKALIISYLATEAKK
jgi:mono/diheme cytochrome c family protein